MSKVAVQSGFKILVVDDDHYVLDSLATMLEIEGHTLVPMNDAKTALFAIGTIAPDLVLLDLHMPGMDGMEFLRAIKSNQHLARIPVIMLSARMDRDSVEAARKLGVIDFLAKPVSAEKLISRLDRLAKARVQEATTHGVAWSRPA
jgi:CheY-like chemotaxis protein